VKSPSSSPGPPRPPSQRRGDPPSFTPLFSCAHPRGSFSRVIIELCCSPDSTIGSVAEKQFSDCRVCRITEKEDFTSAEGQDYVRQLLDECVRAKCPVLIWVAFPCTGGSAWQILNWRKGSDITKSHIRHLWRQLRAMWTAFTRIVLPRINGRSVCLAFEWPAACAYWQWSASTRSLDGASTPEIRETLDLSVPYTALVHGCEHDLIAECGPNKGSPVRKLWRIDTDCIALLKALHRDPSICMQDRQVKWHTYRCIHDRSVKHARALCIRHGRSIAAKFPVPVRPLYVPSPGVSRMRGVYERRRWRVPSPFWPPGIRPLLWRFSAEEPVRGKGPPA